MKNLNNKFNSYNDYPKEEMFNQELNAQSGEYGTSEKEYLDPTLSKSLYEESVNTQYAIATSMLDDPHIMKSDLLSVLATPQGRRFLRRLFRSCGVFDYTPIGDSALYAWHEGRRSIGLIVYHSVFELGANFINQLIMEDINNI